MKKGEKSRLSDREYSALVVTVCGVIVGVLLLGFVVYRFLRNLI